MDTSQFDNFIKKLEDDRDRALKAQEKFIAIISKKDLFSSEIDHSDPEPYKFNGTLEEAKAQAQKLATENNDEHFVVYFVSRIGLLNQALKIDSFNP
jgi:hypothetical protein